MSTYKRASQPRRALLRKVMKERHPKLAKAGVKLDLLVAFAPTDRFGVAKGPALTLGGRPCWATVQKTSQRFRAAGLADAIVTIDGDRWGELELAQQVSILHHELTHLSLEKANGRPLGVDADGRPKLRIKPHDWDFGWFTSVAERDGENSIEVAQLRAFLRQCRSAYGVVELVEQLELEVESSEAAQ